MVSALLLGLLCAAAPAPGTGGRMGVHGMVLFGSGEHLYLSHIPMFRRPHDLQVVLAVQLQHDGISPERAFDDAGYTLEPERFDLDALAAGTLRGFTGTVYQGSFEGGGKPLFTGVRVKVREVVLAARLDAASTPAPTLGYLAVGTPERLYLIHQLSAAPGFDQVLVARARGRLTVPGRGVVLTVARPDTEEERLQARSTEKARAPSGEVPLEIVRELSFLRGPDFEP